MPRSIRVRCDISLTVPSTNVLRYHYTSVLLWTQKQEKSTTYRTSTDGCLSGVEKRDTCRLQGKHLYTQVHTRYLRGIPPTSYKRTKHTYTKPTEQKKEWPDIPLADEHVPLLGEPTSESGMGSRFSQAEITSLLMGTRYPPCLPLRLPPLRTLDALYSPALRVEVHMPY